MFPLRSTQPETLRSTKGASGSRFFVWLFLAAMAPALISGSHAQVTWIGGVGNFYAPTNWSSGFVPQSYDSIVINNGGTVQSSGSVDVANVSIGGNSTYAVMPGITSYFTPDNIYLGTSGLGTMTVGSQALVAAAANIYLGYASGSSGVVSMDGGYLSPFTTYIGYQGNGTMTLENGSTLQSTFGHVGYLPGSTGIVQLNNSTWKAEYQNLPVDITVGEQGNGEIQANNSLISSQNLVLGDSAGITGTVSASGGTVTVQQATQVGNAGTGNLSLSNSANVTSAGVTLGVLSNSSGILSISNSSLDSSANVFVGLSGTGTLVANGAQFKAPEFFIARNGGTSGTTTFSGGHLELTGELHIGAEGNGTFTLQSNGTLHSDKGNMGFAAGSRGVANILSGNWTNTQAIFVGVTGEGTLNIGADGAIFSESGYISQNAAGVGSVSITGGSWTMNNTLAIGVNGSGNLSVTQGGGVSSDWSQLGLHTNSSGAVVLNGGSWTTTQTLTIGFQGSGTFQATNGSALSAGAIELAGSSGVSGSLHLANSTLSTGNLVAGPGNASVGFSSVMLKLLGGASVLDTLLIDGFSSGNAVISAGGLTVDTQGGNAQIASPLTGAGSLTKTGAGRLRLDTANTYGGGTIVEGGALELTGNSNLGAGDVTLRNGELRAHTDSTIGGNLSGGIQLVSVAAGQTGTFSAATGKTLTLSPLDFLLVAGSTMQVGSASNTGNVIFAPTGAAALTADTAIHVAAGTLTAGNAELAFMTSIASSTTVAAGATINFQDILSTGGINALFGAGTVNIGSNSTTMLEVNSGNFSGAISGAGGLAKSSAGILVLSGSSNSYIGGTQVNEGTLMVNGELGFGLGDVQINPTGTLGGNGTMGAITLAGGTLAPGNPSGTLTSGTLYWEGGNIRFDLGPAPDLLALNGALNGLALPSGPYTFDFVNAGWAAGTTYNLITFYSTDISIGSFNFSNGGGFGGDFAYNGNTLQFTVNTVPEPSTWVLLLAGGMLAAVRLRWRARSQA